MDEQYGAHCLADPVFYDSPRRAPGGDVDFAIARLPTPEGWERAEVGDWIAFTPADARMPAQGWKVHASACLDNAEAVLAAVWDHCLARGIPFKLVRGELALLIRNAKYAHRGASGKLATIYPAHEAQLEQVLAELGAALEGQAGPYVLSDLRCGAGPLYVRYGGFVDRPLVAVDGEREAAIEDADGRLVADRREPTFEIPDWVTPPACLEEHLAARARATVALLPYDVEGALHFSNGGGVYVAFDRAARERVVLKEARPHAGLSLDGADAVERLVRERETLQRLAGLDCVPAFKGWAETEGHRFLVEELIDGTTLASLLVGRYPLVKPAADEAACSEYAAWALDVCARVESGVDAIHERGVVIGDLQPANVLVRPDGRCVLIDFEAATHVSEGRRSPLAAPGFAAPADRTGFDVDRYALACLRLGLFMPITELLGLDPGKAAQLAREIAAVFPVPGDFLAAAVRTIEGPAPRRTRVANDGGEAQLRFEPTPAGWPPARDSMARAILASATPERDDRLFPGDVAQFAPGGGLNLAHGAAGVLYSLQCAGAGSHPDHEEWLVEHARSAPPETPVGLYDGLHGVAHTLDCLGRRPEALELLETCLDRGWAQLGLDLRGGLSGIGLNLAHFAAATDDAALWDATWAVADAVAERLGDRDGVAEVSGGDEPYAGLLRGSSGPALLFVRLHERTRDGALLDLAATALHQDLRRCVEVDGGALEVREPWRSLPYLAEGSAGIGMVLEDFLAHRPDERFEQAAAAIRAAAGPRFYAEPGLFRGRGGMIAHLSRTQSPTRDRDVAEHVHRLAWHAVPFGGGIAFPGERLLRLSMDLATGTAGVMLAVGSALHAYDAHLPFLAPLGSDALTDPEESKSSVERR
jgi:serine/threonine protein kinase